MKRWLIRLALPAIIVGSMTAILPATAYAGGNIWIGNCYYQIFRPNNYLDPGGSNYEGYGSISCSSESTGLDMQLQVWQLVTGGWQVVPGSTLITQYGNISANEAFPAYSNPVSPVYKRWYCTWAWAQVNGQDGSNYSLHSTQAGTGATGTCP
jgi:hypothetical protein